MYSIKVAFTQESEPDFISRSIMKILNKPYSHVLIMYEDVDGKEKILHAIGGGTQIDADKKYLETHKIVRQYTIPMKVSREVFSGYAQGRVGRDYAETNYINMALEYVGIKWIPFKNGKGEGVCSTEIAAAASMSALAVSDTFELELIDPADVDHFLAGQKEAHLDF